MFACLTVHEGEPHGIFRKIIKILTGSKTETEIRSACGVEYLHIETWPDKHGVDWALVRQCAGRFADRLLPPRGYSLPPESGMQAFRCDSFDREVLKATACELINRTRMPMYRRVLGLVDEHGLYTGMLYELLKYYTSVKVVTQASKAYATAAQDIMEHMGAPVLFGGDVQSLAECVLVLAPDGIAARLPYRLECPVMTARSGLIQEQSGLDVFSDLSIRLPGDLLSDVPEGIDPHFFMGALYEYGNVQPPGFAADNLLYGNKSASLAEAVEIISRRAGTFMLT